MAVEERLQTSGAVRLDHALLEDAVGQVSDVHLRPFFSEDVFGGLQPRQSSRAVQVGGHVSAPNSHFRTVGFKKYSKASAHIRTRAVSFFNFFMFRIIRETVKIVIRFGDVLYPAKGYVEAPYLCLRKAMKIIWHVNLGYMIDS